MPKPSVYSNSCGIIKWQSCPYKIIVVALLNAKAVRVKNSSETIKYNSLPCKRIVVALSNAQDLCVRE